MISNWTGWKPYPDAARGQSIEAPIGPGLYEVRDLNSGAVYAFGAAESVALELAQLPRRRAGATWFSRRKTVSLPLLEYRTFAAPTFAAAKGAAAHLFGRREVFFSGAA